MSTKPRNLKGLDVYDGGEFSNSHPYVYFNPNPAPQSWHARTKRRLVTLDGKFEVEDLEWIAKKMREGKS